MTISVEVGCALPAYSGQGAAILSPELISSENIAEDEIIKIKSQTGRSVLAKVVTSALKEAERKKVYLDHYLRGAIKVSPGEEVKLEKIVVAPVKRAFFMLIKEIPSELEGIKAQIKKTFIEQATPISSGLMVTVPLTDQSGITILKVTDVDPAAGLINTETQVEILLPSSLAPFQSEHEHDHSHGHVPISDVTYEDVGGLGEEIKIVKELVEVPLRFPEVYAQLGINLPRGIIFHGPAGVGKTHLALAVSNEIDTNLFYINGPEIVSTEFGETESNLRQIFQEAINHQPAIILIDEIDAIAPKRGETGSFTSSRTVSNLLSLLDGLKKAEGVIVIGTTNSLDAIDTALRRSGRFDREIFLASPDTSARMEILRIHTRAMPLIEETVDYLQEVAQKTIGFVGADLMELCREAGLNAFRRNFGVETNYSEKLLTSLKTLAIEKLDFEKALNKIRPSALRAVIENVSDIGWNDIGGLEEVKKQLQELVQIPMLNPEALSYMKIHPPSGVLLHGKPGTGKTLLVKALARESRANFISVRGSEIFSKWLGESEATIRSIFQLAYRVAPAIIFLDQIDAIARHRGQEVGAQATERVVNQLQIELDGIQPGSRLVVLAATNRIDLIDPALLQANRLGAQIFIPMPDEQARSAILAIYLRGIPLAKKSSMDEIAKTMAASSDGLSGAELESLCYRAKILALRGSDFKKAVPVKLKHFKEALKQVKGS